jgi:hypothetical protein
LRLVLKTAPRNRERVRAIDIIEAWGCPALAALPPWTGVAAGVAGGGPATLPRGPMYFFFFLPPRLLSVVSIADRSLRGIGGGAGSSLVVSTPQTGFIDIS